MAEWGDRPYFWVVICKNHPFHEHENKWFGHRILLGETDAYSPLPVAQGSVRVVCDACGREYEYGRKEILRAEADPAPGFVEHPLFHEAWV